MIYGNASTSIMIKNQHLLNTEVRMNLFIMKLAEMKTMLGKEKNILNLAQANAT